MNDLPPPRRPSGPMLGGAWAAALAGTLLLALGASAASRWWNALASREEIVQLPVPDVAPATKRAPTAPDPGDQP